ncbi:Probable plastid-lipid-associated protein 11, chloroplastic [Linum perenne]
MHLNGIAASHQHSLLQFPNPFKSPKPLKKARAAVNPKIKCSLAKQRLLNLISDQDRGIRTQKDPQRLNSIVEAINEMAELGRDTITTGDSLSATWRLMWTTEKEQLFIIDKAGLVGTKAGDVLQVIDVEKGVLNNVITFPPHGVFFVRFETVYLDDEIRVAKDIRNDYLVVDRAPYSWKE